MTKTDELLPCPFCGCNVKEQDVEQSPLVDFYCMNCDARFGWVTKEHSVAKKLFNTRTAEAPLLAEIERLKSELLQRDAIWLPEKDAEIERLKSKLEQIGKIDTQYIEYKYGYWEAIISKSDIDKILESK